MLRALTKIAALHFEIFGEQLAQSSHAGTEMFVGKTHVRLCGNIQTPHTIETPFGVEDARGLRSSEARGQFRV